MTNDHARSQQGSSGTGNARAPALFVREGGRIVAAPPEDVAVALTYPAFGDKGPLIDGQRLTLLCRKLSYAPGELIRLIHVAEVTDPGRPVYVMGPKQVYGEYLDGDRVSPPMPVRDDPLVPENYDGATLPGPAIDYNYEITTYNFKRPGTHLFQWRLGALRSNTLTIVVGAEGTP